MAIQWCSSCERAIDLDYESEGQWNDDGDYMCEQCIEWKEAEHDGNPEPN